MAEKTWTSDADFAESKGDFDGCKWASNKLKIHLEIAFESRTWLDATDETEEWIASASAYVARGYWIVNFDGGEVDTGWGLLSWNATEPDSSNVKLRARSATTEAGLAGATWTSYYETSGTDNEAPNNRWLQLEVVLEEGSTPLMLDISQLYGPGC